MQKLSFKLILLSTILITGLLNGQVSVTGNVTDDSNVPLPGANIVEKSTSNGVTSDFDVIF